MEFKLDSRQLKYYMTSDKLLTVYYEGQLVGTRVAHADPYNQAEDLAREWIARNVTCKNFHLSFEMVTSDCTDLYVRLFGDKSMGWYVRIMEILHQKSGSRLLQYVVIEFDTYTDAFYYYDLRKSSYDIKE